MEFMNEARRPGKLAGDKAYDCDALDIMLEDLGIEMISPHRRNRKPPTRYEISDKNQKRLAVKFNLIVVHFMEKSCDPTGCNPVPTGAFYGSIPWRSNVGATVSFGSNGGSSNPFFVIGWHED